MLMSVLELGLSVIISFDKKGEYNMRANVGGIAVLFLLYKIIKIFCFLVVAIVKQMKI